MHTKKVVAPDVFDENECMMFDKSSALLKTPAIPELAAVCIVSTELGLPREMELLDKACADYATPLLFANPLMNEDYKVWLFASHGPWQPDSAMVRHHRLWKSFSSTWRLDDFRLAQEIMVESSEGIRFAGVAEVSKDNLFTATQILRSESSCAIIVSTRANIRTESGVMHLFDSAFPLRNRVAQPRIDWLTLSLSCCQLSDVVVRVGGSWDEREASLDLLMLSNVLPVFS